MQANFATQQLRPPQLMNPAARGMNSQRQHQSSYDNPMDNSDETPLRHHTNLCVSQPSYHRYIATGSVSLDRAGLAGALGSDNMILRQGCWTRGMTYRDLPRSSLAQENGGTLKYDFSRAASQSRQKPQEAWSSGDVQRVLAMRALALLKGASSLPPLELDRNWNDARKHHDFDSNQKVYLFNRNQSLNRRNMRLSDHHTDSCGDFHDPVGIPALNGPPTQGRDTLRKGGSYEKRMPRYTFGLCRADPTAIRSLRDQDDIDGQSGLVQNNYSEQQQQLLQLNPRHGFSPSQHPWLTNFDRSDSGVPIHGLTENRHLLRKHASFDNEWPIPPLILPDSALPIISEPADHERCVAVGLERQPRRLSDWSDTREISTCHATLRKLKRLWDDVQLDDMPSALGDNEAARQKHPSADREKAQSAILFPWCGSLSLTGPSTATGTQNDKSFVRESSSGVSFPSASTLTEREDFRTRYPHYSLCSTTATGGGGGGSVYSSGGDMELDWNEDMKQTHPDCVSTTAVRCVSPDKEGIARRTLETVESNDRRSSASSGTSTSMRLWNLTATAETLHLTDDEGDELDFLHGETGREEKGESEVCQHTGSNGMDGIEADTHEVGSSSITEEEGSFLSTGD